MSASGCGQRGGRDVACALIWARDLDDAIGTGTAMPWHVPADFAHFKRTTMGCPIVMGRATWQSIGARALPGRPNIVLSTRPGFVAPGARVATSLAALEPLLAGAKRWWVIGGARVYSQFLSRASLAVVTTVQLHSGAAVTGPRLTGWRHEDAASDPAGAWRPRSGDARWRVDTWRA